MMVAEGILTARGGLVSHAAVVARGWGTPGGRRRRGHPDQGTTFTRRRRRRQARATSSRSTARPARSSSARSSWPRPSRRPSSRPSSAGPTTSAGASSTSGPTPTTAPTPRTPASFGAEGIGLCRTEHMFLGEDRLPVVRRMILADTPEEETAALEELREVQKADFVEILEAMDGLPVTVRLLDPPLHEFLPRVDELRVKAATAGLDDEEEELLDAAEAWARVQPHARHPRRAPRRHEAGPLRHAGAGAAWRPPPSCASGARTRSSR